MHSEPALWRQILRQNFTKWQRLADFLELTDQQSEFILKNSSFLMNVPMRLAKKMLKGTLDDPILRQFLPTQEEKNTKLGFVKDPVCDQTFRKESKLLQKYNERALLICTSACAMHCRYCFRQNFDYDVRKSLYEKELALIEQDVSLKEIILSGGDPLSLDNSQLRVLLQSLNKIPHIRRIRFHTRFPIGIPERIDEEFLEILKSLEKQVWFVIHSNHPKELDEDVITALKSIFKLGIPVLNQSVLLKGVNDQASILKELSEKLVDHGFIPYYLHQLDKLESASHFEVSVEEGKSIIKDLTSQLSGYAVPKYVSEIPGAESKTPL